MKQEVGIILGSGFSHVAGLPLTKNLFEDKTKPFIKSLKAEKVYEKVKHAWEENKRNNKEVNAELWMNSIYYSINERNPTVTWDEILYYLLAKLVIIDSKSPKAVYLHGITKSCCSKTHQSFWQHLLKKYDIKTIITTNYDILIEQGLRNKYDRFRDAPLCYYGGLHKPQIVKRVRDVIKQKYILTELNGDISLCKLHGSLNWEIKDDNLYINECVHSAFRVTKKPTTAIVPPIIDKRPPKWLESIWRYAEGQLMNTKVWIVCGFALNKYDEALYNFFKNISQKIDNLLIYLIDPQSENLASKWKEFTKNDCIINTLPGLPEVLDDDRF